MLGRYGVPHAEVNNTDQEGDGEQGRGQELKGRPAWAERYQEQGKRGDRERVAGNGEGGQKGVCW